jgi:hypothetical protein
LSTTQFLKDGGVLERGGIRFTLAAFFFEPFLPLPEVLRDFEEVEVIENA